LWLKSIVIQMNSQVYGYINSLYKRRCWCLCPNMYITLDLPFQKNYNPFTNERIHVYLDIHNCMFLNTKDYFVKQIYHLSKGVVIVASAYCRFSTMHISEKRIISFCMRSFVFTRSACHMTIVTLIQWI